MNNLISLKKNYFIGMDNLKSFAFDSNKCKFIIEEDAFVYLKNLKLLSLSYNLIKYLSKSQLNGLESLEDLLLNENEFYEPESIELDNLSNLTTLSLRGNLIKKLELSYFKNLEKLEFLDFNTLDYCEVKSDKNILSNLKYFRLRAIQIPQCLNSNLTSLKISGLKKFESQDLKQFSNLILLSLSFENDLVTTELMEYFKNGFDKLVYLNIEIKKSQPFAKNESENIQNLDKFFKSLVDNSNAKFSYKFEKAFYFSFKV